MHDDDRVKHFSANLKALALLLCGLWLAAGPLAADEVRIGVLARRDHGKCLEKWTPTANYLSTELPSHHFVIIPMSFNDIPVIVKNRMVDFVIVNPGIYINLSVKYGARRILTLINELSGNTSQNRFGSVIFTLKTNTAPQNLADLRNERIAAVHPISLGGWVMAQREIRNAGIARWELTSPAFLNTHDAVVNAVLAREADVGIVRTDTLERMALEHKIDLGQIRVINPRRFRNFPYRISTPLYPEWPFAQLAHTSQQLAKEVSIALLRLPAEHPAAKLARIRGWTIPEEYQPVRDLYRLLELPPYEPPLEQSLLDSLASRWHILLPLLLAILFLVAVSVRMVRLNRSLREHKSTLKASREAQIATFEQAAVGLAHISLTGRLLNMNKRLCAITGYPGETLRETNLKDLVYNEDLAQVTEIFDLLRGGQQADAAIQFRLRCADTSLKWCQLSLSYKPNDKDTPSYLVAVIDDIDHYKQLEEESHQAQQQRELILNIAGDGILGLDHEGRHTFVNPAAAELLGYNVEELANENCHALWRHSHHDDDHASLEECPLLEVLRNGKTYRGTNETLWRKDGSAIQVEYVGTPIITKGLITGAVVVFRPIDAT